MKATQIYAVLLALLLIVTMASSQKYNAPLIIRANNKFTSVMYDVLRKTPGNVIYSPISLHTTLSMLQQGAESETLKALSSTLKLPDKASSADGFQKITAELNNINGVTFKMANKMYLQQGYAFKGTFAKVVMQKFNTVLESIDLEGNEITVKAVNNWIKKQTGNQIKDWISVDNLGKELVVLIVNTIYFKGDWLMKFDRSNTCMQPFYKKADIEVIVDMMQINGQFDYKLDSFLEAKIVKLPYTNRDFSMVIVLPNNGSEITKLENKLAYYDLSTLTRGMDNTELELSMPRFKFEMDVDLNEPLKKAGFSNIFSHSNNLSGILSVPIYVGRIMQKIVIEVNEGGSEAAATTDLDTSTKEGTMSLKYNRPFIFALLHKTNILFYGKIASI